MFVEGKDFQVLGKFARKLNYTAIGNRSDFAVIPVEGFSPERIRSLKKGIETTLGGKIAAAAILDRDYRSQAECDEISRGCGDFCDVVRIHSCKEVENFLLSATAIDRAAASRVADRIRRSGHEQSFVACASGILDEFASHRKMSVMSQYLAFRRRFQRAVAPTTDDATANEAVLAEFEARWEVGRLGMVSGKDALSNVNECLQQRHGVSVTTTGIIDAMWQDEVPAEVDQLLKSLSAFLKIRPGAQKTGAE